MTFPVTVVKDKEEAKVLHSVDLEAWLKAGWKVKTKQPQPQTKEPEKK